MRDMLSRDKKPTLSHRLLEFGKVWFKAKIVVLPPAEIVKRIPMTHHKLKILFGYVCALLVTLGALPIHAQNATPIANPETPTELPQPYLEVEYLKNQTADQALAAAKLLHKLGAVVASIAAQVVQRGITETVFALDAARAAVV